MCFDGTVNHLGYGIEAVLISPIDALIPTTAKLHFICPNNIAEYEAYIISLKAAIDLGID